ncbi:MAG TPA: gfo/Idh/MocA family oxidoreductase [Planctomycetaceae bacterium]|nr:gfo/Idh/MocA family oxidoreductase [Planctomycetaceae bacterium]
MTSSTKPGMTRRELFHHTGKIAAATALANAVLPGLYAGESNTIQLALVGCGGRGTGAAANALSTKSGPTKLVAMADVFPKKLEKSHKDLGEAEEGALAKQLDVPEDRRFIGFDGYKKAMDCLKPGDVVLLTTPPAFRWVQFGYAISKGLNVFMEKPTTVDGPSTRKMLDLAAESVKRNLKVGVGLMCRHCEARKELLDRIKSGEIGDIVLMRAYRMAPGKTAHEFCKAAPSNMSELLYQIQEFHAFLWASGGAYSDFLIHNIDECCWMKDAWPVEAKGLGGRHYRGDYVDQNFDTYAVEYTFADGSKLQLDGRCMEGAYGEFASYAHGTKNSAVISTAGHTPANCRIYKGQKLLSKDHLLWHYGQPKEPNPYQLEWDELIDAIRQDRPYNEAKRGAEASLVTAMGRMSAHTGQVVTFEDMLACEHEFAPNVDKLTLDGPAPLVAGPDGKYPVPEPGLNKKREY